MQILRTEEQAVLSARLVEPRLQDLLEMARRSRTEVDEELHADLAAGREVANTPEPRQGEYPIGFCFAICMGVLQHLSSEPLVQEFLAAGVTWKLVYFIQEDRLFQHAIQCGDFLLDVANDSCDLGLPPVVCTPLARFDWDNLRNYKQTAAVATQYYGVRLFPNRFFPLLFPAVPFLSLTPDGGIEIFRHEHLLFFLDINEGWPRIRELIADTEWITQPLPPAHAARLAWLQEMATSNPPPVVLRESTPEELLAGLSQWDALHRLAPERLAATIANLGARIDATAIWLRQSG
jgi:hypothetical protein